MKNVIFYLYTICVVISCGESDPVEIVEPQIKGEFIDEWTYRVFPGITDNFDVAEFRIWIPENRDDLRAVLILASSYNSNALGLVASEYWREYAKKEQLALVSLKLQTHENNGNGYYGEASGGSGAALLLALNELADKHDFTRLKTMPLLVRGYSAGGVFGHYLSELIPQRMVAFANIRGGSVGPTSVENKEVPGLMILGENDIQSRNLNMINSVIQKRIDGGLWCYVIESGTDHFGELTDSDELITNFFSIVLEKRLPHEASGQLQNIVESSGWLGDHGTLRYFSFDNILINRQQASWLVDESFAMEWQNFQLK